MAQAKMFKEVSKWSAFLLALTKPSFMIYLLCPFNFTVVSSFSVAVLFHLDFIIINTGWISPLSTKTLQ